MNEDRELHNAQRLSETYRTFTAAHHTRRCELFDSWVDTVLRIWQRSGRGGAQPPRRRHRRLSRVRQCQRV